jgi:hypothetical protein
MSGGYQPPFRMPCEEVAGNPTIFIGPPIQHSHGPELVHKYSNTTTVDGDPPGERFHDNSGGAACELANGSPLGTWTEPVPANVFTDTGDFVDMAVSRKRGWKAVQGARSPHGTLPWTAPEAGCKTNLCDDGVSGYQAYQSSPSQLLYRTWTPDVHMRNHFDAGEDAGGYWNADKTGARTVAFNNGQVTAPDFITSEERAANFGSGAVIIRHVDGGAGYTDVDGDGVHESDFDSGGTTILDNLDNDLHCSYPHFRADADFDLPGFISAWNGAGHTTPMPLMTDPNSYSCSITSVDADGTWTITASFSRSATVVSWHFTIHQSDIPDGEDNTWEYYGTLTLSDATNFDAYLADCYVLTATWNLTDDHEYPFRTERRGSLAPYVTRKEMDSTSPIGFNPVNVDDPTSPGDLMAWYDDRVYDPADGRTLIYDGSIIGAPKPAGYQNPFIFTFTDVRGCCNKPGDGSTTWVWYPYGTGIYIDDFNTLAGTQIPRNATQVNNYFMAVDKPVWAWIKFADKNNYFPPDCINSDNTPSGAGDTSKIVACKFCEILELWPSQNFYGPAGDMKFWYDETKVACATNVSGSGEGSVWALIDPRTGSAPTWPDPDLIVGGPVVGGFYATGSWDGTNITLGAKQFDLPSNWASKSKPGGTGDDATCFGALRWDTYPSLLGRAAITTIGTTATFATAQPAFGMNSSTHQEQVDLYDASMTAVATNVTATRVDDTHFTTSSAYATAVWVQIHGSPKWYMNDDSPKGDGTALQFWTDTRPAGEQARIGGGTDCDGDPIAVPSDITYADADCNGTSLTVAFPGYGYRKFCQQQFCIPFRPCAPRVLCFSPNGEVFPNGITIAMPTTLVWDSQYGNEWQGVGEFTMVDVFYQEPHFPCNIASCSHWKMDNGLCNGDNPTDCGADPAVGCPDEETDGTPCDETSTPPTYYFPLAPLVEARLTVPSNYGAAQDESAPALPTGIHENEVLPISGGIQIGWLSPVNNAPNVEGVALPPVPPGPESSTGRPGLCAFTWSMHEDLCDAQTGGCRFTYNLLGC